MPKPLIAAGPLRFYLPLSGTFYSLSEHVPLADVLKCKNEVHLK